MKIHYIPSDFDAPGFYRCLSPGKQLSEHGHEVTLPDFKAKKMPDGRHRVEYDIIFELPRSADLYVLQQRKERVWHEEIDRLHRFGIAVVADVDDNYVNLPPYNPAFWGTHSYRRDDGVILNREMRRNIKKRTGFVPPPNSSNAHHLNEQLRKMDLVTVSTPFLANVYERFNKNIKVVRNYLDWDIWRDITPQYEEKRNRLRIGYLAVYRFRRGDLAVLGNSVRRFLRDHPEVDFVTNSAETHEALGVPEGQRITIGEYDFQPIVDGIPTGNLPVGRMTAVCDIGLVPLAMNDLNQSKSHLKGMEYNAAGIPFIASPTESYLDYWCDYGYNGLIAHGENEWYEAMRALVEDPSMRESMGLRGRHKAGEHTIQKNWQEWENVYSGVLEHAAA